MLLMCFTTEIFICFNCACFFPLHDHKDNKHVPLSVANQKCVFSPPSLNLKAVVQTVGRGSRPTADKITTSNVVPPPHFQLMGLFLHRQSFSPWGICSLSIKSFATVPHLQTLNMWGISQTNARHSDASLCPERKGLTANIHLTTDCSLAIRGP